MLRQSGERGDEVNTWPFAGTSQSVIGGLRVIRMTLGGMIT
jgi:hypothetical protein